MNSLIPLKFDLVREFIGAPVTCKFDEDSIKIEGHYRSDKVKYGLICHSRANNSEVDSSIWSKFELIQDFMTVPIICKIDEDLNKSEIAIIPTTFSPL